MVFKEVVIRLLLAIIAGGIIGSERERNNHPAGIKTHILVTVGACMVSIAAVMIMEKAKQDILLNPVLKDAIKVDLGRMSAQVISGIGFLGAGTILHAKGSVTGLTTAATLWVTGCIGITIGFGFYIPSILGTALVMGIIILLKFIQARIIKNKWLKELEIKFIKNDDTIEKLEKFFQNKNIKIKSVVYLSSERASDSNQDIICKCRYYIVLPRNLKLYNIINNLYMYSYIVDIQERSKIDSIQDINNQTGDSLTDDD